MTRIIWFSRHSPTRQQRTELESLFGPLALIHDARAFDTADDVAARFKQSGALEMVAVAPDSVLRALVKAGIQPLHAKMARCDGDDPRCEVTIKSRFGTIRHYRHVRFERVLRADFTTIEVKPRFNQKEKQNVTSESR